MPSELGITGSRFGCNKVQYKLLRGFLDMEHAIHQEDLRLHTGCCLGIDELAAVHLYFKFGTPIVAHQPVDKKYLSILTLSISSIQLPPLEYLERNQTLVKSVSRLIGVPENKSPMAHSGTWYTINQARQRKIPVTIINPDGTISDESDPFS